VASGHHDSGHLQNRLEAPILICWRKTAGRIVQDKRNIDWFHRFSLSPVVGVVVGAGLFVVGAVVVARPAVELARGGPAASFTIVGPYLALVILAALGALAGVISWIHDQRLFTTISVAMWSLTLVSLFVAPGPAFTFAALSALGTLLFYMADDAGATGLAFSLQRARPSPQPPADYRPGHDISRTRRGIIEAHRRDHGDETPPSGPGIEAPRGSNPGD
jgi:hypothetical protein